MQPIVVPENSSARMVVASSRPGFAIRRWIAVTVLMKWIAHWEVFGSFKVNLQCDDSIEFGF